jgi:hypothetical protein
MQTAHSYLRQQDHRRDLNRAGGVSFAVLPGMQFEKKRPSPKATRSIDPKIQNTQSSVPNSNTES